MPNDFMKKTARDMIVQPVVTAEEDMTVTELMELMLRWRMSGMPVVDSKGKPVGSVSQDDILNCAVSGIAREARVREVMTSDIETCSPDMPLVDMANYYAENWKNEKDPRVAIVESEKVIGIITRRDIMREIVHIYDQY